MSNISGLLLVSILLSLPGDGDHEDPVSLEDVGRIVDVPFLPGEGRVHVVVHIAEAGISSTCGNHGLRESPAWLKYMGAGWLKYCAGALVILL